MLNRIQKLSRDLNATSITAGSEARLRSKKARASLQHVDWDASNDLARRSPNALQTRR